MKRARRGGKLPLCRRCRKAPATVNAYCDHCWVALSTPPDDDGPLVLTDDHGDPL